MKDFMETVRGGKKAIRNEERKKKKNKTSYTTLLSQNL